MKQILLTILVFLVCSPVMAHLTTTEKVRAEIHIPELVLFPERLRTNGGPHIHVGFVNELSTPGGGRYSCGALGEGRAKKAMDVVQKTLTDSGVVPQMRYLILCSGVTAKNQPIGGIPVPPYHLLMLDIGPPGSDSLPHTFWHEAFHYAEMQAELYVDKLWVRKYKGYTKRYDLSSRGLQILGGGDRGFLNLYSQSFPHEERAEFAAWMIHQPQVLEKFLEKRGDYILNAKKHSMTVRLKELGWR